MGGTGSGFQGVRKAAAANSGETAPAWPRGRPFRKGQSGNPSGRPRRDHDIGQLARSHTAAAVETLVLIMRSPSTPASSRVMAASALLDRGWGKAPRSIAVDQKDSFSDQFEAFIRELQSKGSAGLLPKRTPIS